MLNKEEHIHFWVKQADDDWGAAEALFAAEKYVQSLFWAHLVVEKYAKAIWIKHNTDNIPPKTHNIAFLISRTPIESPIAMTEIMLLANRFNLEGRYPGHVEDLEMVNSKSFAENINHMKQLIKWLKENLH
jgi:HEPN domain-containing protein